VTRPLGLAVLGVVGLAALAMLAIVAAGWSQRVEYVMAVSGLLVAVTIALRRLLATVAPPPWPSPVPARRGPAVADPRTSSIESTLRRATDDAGICRRRAQPLLLDLAIHRLSRHRGVGLVEDPEEARRVLGDDAFHFLSDVVEGPTTAATLAQTVDAIERL
jgi:hypothetical protein